MKEIVLTLVLLVGLAVIAPLIILIRILFETIANTFNRFIGWVTSFIPAWLKGK